jgi:hypothetical protein
MYCLGYNVLLVRMSEYDDRSLYYVLLQAVALLVGKTVGANKCRLYALSRPCA